MGKEWAKHVWLRRVFGCAAACAAYAGLYFAGAAAVRRAPGYGYLFGWLTHPGQPLWWGAMAVSALPAACGWGRCAGVMTGGFAASVLLASALSAETAWAVWAALFLASALAGFFVQSRCGDVSDERLAAAAAVATVITIAAGIAAAYLAVFLLVFAALLWAFVIWRVRH